VFVRCCHSILDAVMDQQLRQWKVAVDRFWSQAIPEYREVARLVAEIAGSGADDTLRHAASQALPSLRNAAAKSAGCHEKEIGRRRLSIVRDALHTLAAPRFGKRGVTPKALTAEEQYRQVLDLPFGRRLAAAEIHQAYKRAAKTRHPDGGGNAREFLALSAARDALMKRK
jgi:hypothetical protein